MKVSSASYHTENVITFVLLSHKYMLSQPLLQKFHLNKNQKGFDRISHKARNFSFLSKRPQREKFNLVISDLTVCKSGRPKETLAHLFCLLCKNVYVHNAAISQPN